MLGGRAMMAEAPKLAASLPPFPGLVLRVLDRLHGDNASLD